MVGNTQPSTPAPLHPAYRVPSPLPLPLLTQSHTHPPTPTSPPALTTYMFSPCLRFPPPSAPPQPGALSPSHTFPIAACSQPAHLLEGRNHSFSLGFSSLAVKCKGGSKIQLLLSAGVCMAEQLSVCVSGAGPSGFEPPLYPLSCVALEKSKSFRELPLLHPVNTILDPRKFRQLRGLKRWRKRT